jgi:hypothetical protein
MKTNSIYTNDIYTKLQFPRKQVRDSIEGSNAVKRGNEIYLPMTAAMRSVDQDTEVGVITKNSDSQVDVRNTPWWHPNPAYRAYLQRARFPDITGAILRGLIGTCEKGETEVDVPGRIKYLIDNASTDGMTLDEIAGQAISETLQTSKFCLILEPQTDNTLKIVKKEAEANTDFDFSFSDGVESLQSATFFEADSDEGAHTIEYKIVDGKAVYQRFIDDVEDGVETEITLQGKTIPFLPIVFIGSVENTPRSKIIPLLGVSDIAISIYQKDADLTQAEFMTCNPTLFMFGVQQDEKPKWIGSAVCVTTTNPDARAEYPATDTSALDHMMNRIDSLKQEAVDLAGQILTGKRGAEAAEALSIRQASSGANLLKIVNNTSKGIRDILNMAAKWTGEEGGCVFKLSTDFANKDLSPAGMRAYVESWLDGAISHDTVLNKFRDADILGGNVTNEQEKLKILMDEELKIGFEPKKTDETEK